MPKRTLRQRSGRRGMTLMEIMVVLAIMAGVFFVAVSSLSSLLGVERHVATKKLASTYRYLREEAGLKNVVFRIAFDLDENTWSVQVGDPSSLIFYDQETRETHEDQLRSELNRYTQREIEEGKAEETVSKLQNFQSTTDEILAQLVDPGKKASTGEEDAENTEADEEGAAKIALPAGTVFAWVHTPQYEDPVVASDSPPEDDEPHAMAYSYIFPNGYAEPTFIRIVDANNFDKGYTIEVEALSGRVIIHHEEVELEDALGWMPEEGPELEG